MTSHRIIASILFVLAAAPAQATDCPALFLGGRAPEVIQESLAAKVRPLCFKAFSLLHSGVTRTALWSAERLTRESIGDARSMERVNTFKAEMQLPAAERAELSDYSRSGFDRGHLAPSGDMPDPDAQDESFSLANMIPQDPDNNRNLWAAIESAVRDLAIRSGEVYVVTGPIFSGTDLKALRGRVLVPTHLFKAVYDSRTRRAGAYIAENVPGFAWRAVTLHELQGYTGIDVFPALPAQAKASLMDMPVPRQRAAKSAPSAEAAGSVAWDLAKRAMKVWQ